MTEILLALGYFSGLTLVFLVKLLPVWGTMIPGGLQDTRLFLWNGWWFHYAITVLHTNPFRTSMLFYPFGYRLVSHDFPLWMNLVTFSAQQAGFSLIAASNLWFALTWMLAGFCTFLLAREVTGSSPAAFAAGTLAMTHSYTLARAMQNWGQFNIYGIALFLWLLVRSRRRRDPGSFALAGAALAWTAACHLYFLIYSVMIWLAVAAVDLSPVRLKLSLRAKRSNLSFSDGLSLTRVCLVGLAVACGVIGIGISRHPGVHHLAGTAISMTTPENAIFALWILLMAWGATYLSLSFPRKRESRNEPGLGALWGLRCARSMDSRPTTAGDDVKLRLVHHTMLIGTAVILLSPLFWETFKLILAGGYPKQSILWKTHLRGADIFSLFMPNPLNLIWGPATSRWFAERGMAPQDQAASIGWVCMAAILFSRVWKENQRARLWLSLALASTILAMGTHLHVAQYNLWCPLPFFWLRLLPVIGNVRVPERWMAVGAIAWSVVVAMALTKLARTRAWSINTLSVIAVTLVLIENWPGIPYQSLPPSRAVYSRLRELPPGAVLPIPLYIGDSSIGTGNAANNGFIFPWDHLWAQVYHQKPMLGGYAGRISRNLIEFYKSDPFIRTLLDLEEDKITTHLPQLNDGWRAIETFQFRYVLVYPGCTEPAVLNFVLGSLPLELIAKDDAIQLYRISEF